MDPTPDEVARAQAAGAAAAAEAQRIADDAEPSIIDRFEQQVSDAATGTVDFFLAPFDYARAQANAAFKEANAQVDHVANIMKWVAIVALVMVAVLAALWIAAVVFGAVWAGTLLRDVLPDVAVAAVGVARATR